MVTYVLDRIIGRGGSGTVYLAELHGPAGFVKPVAIKLIRADKDSEAMVGLLRDEARLLGMARDRALVSVEPPIRVDNQWAMVMEYVEGASTRELLTALGPLPASAVIDIAGEVARCLDAVHHQHTPNGTPLSLVHRDLKPSNLLLTTSGTVKVLDLGIAVATVQLDTVDPPGQVVGSRAYMPPERVRGPEGPAGDVYSLGATMRRLATGDRPLGFGEWEPRKARANDPLLTDLLALAQTCQADDPEDRPTMRELERECVALLHRFAAPPLREWAEAAVPHAMYTAHERVGARIVCVDPRTSRYTIERAEGGGQGPRWWHRLLPSA